MSKESRKELNECQISELIAEVKHLQQREKDIDAEWENYRELYDLLNKVFGSPCNLQHYPAYWSVCTRPHFDEWNFTATFTPMSTSGFISQ